MGWPGFARPAASYARYSMPSENSHTAPNSGFVGHANAACRALWPRSRDIDPYFVNACVLGGYKAAKGRKTA